MADPFKKLAATLETRLSGMAAKAVSGLPSELGTITGSGLKLDSFKYEIPDYLVADWTAKLHFPAFSLVGTMTSPVDGEGVPQGGAVPGPRTRFDFEEAEVEDVRLNWQSGLKAGDRVLAVPVNGGRDAVVLCKVVGSGG
ncbi:hypothetical protein GE107_15395 [Cohnella sp. CFH 77786]|uniref:hypothetical protein n=1 Tax=Cohnella sp. CFH 77786 TaxID=2662265 RepID=UPI001C608D62|nr:hypothetical protein [Cohnella sp. CFH 77786]MBW5447442.1 hypothetical protein [Cohnella sp. CFH 77786]